MKCPHCAGAVDDNSVYCPHCGEAMGQRFCAKCGGSMDKKESSGSKGLLVIVLIMFASGLLALQITHPIPPASLATSSVQSSSIPQKPYTIVSSEDTTFAGHTMYSLQVRLNPFSGRAGIVVAARDIAREKLLTNASAIVDMRLYTTDAYRDAPENFDARAIVVDFDKNPAYQLPGQGFDDQGEHLFIQWRNQ